VAGDRIGVLADSVAIRCMKTKWGSCTRETRGIRINLELATRYPRCLEYVLVHELTHLLERSHNHRFVSLMDQFMPNWRSIRDELNQSPLSYDVWGPEPQTARIDSEPGAYFRARCVRESWVRASCSKSPVSPPGFRKNALSPQ
jgi:hypothetical protein